MALLSSLEIVMAVVLCSFCYHYKVCESLTLDNCDSAVYTHCTYIDTLIKEAVEKDLVDQWIMTK